jgi:hypothetical protein
MSDTTPAPQVRPTLRARDAPGLITFLVDASGFEATVVYGDGDRVDHAQPSWPLGAPVASPVCRRQYRGAISMPVNAALRPAPA